MIENPSLGFDFVGMVMTWEVLLLKEFRFVSVFCAPFPFRLTVTDSSGAESRSSSSGIGYNKSEEVLKIKQTNTNSAIDFELVVLLGFLLDHEQCMVKQEQLQVAIVALSAAASF